LLQLQRVRQLLGSDCTLSDEQLAALRDQLRTLADVAVDLVACHAERESQRASVAPILRLVPPERREEVEERAAIREYDGGMSRAHAERAALADLGFTLNGVEPCRER
jgi:hypothetical protein